jgi:hypothetical protein
MRRQLLKAVEMRSGMGRFALALAAILILTLSAGLTGGQSGAPLGMGAAGGAVFQETTDTFRAELLLMQREQLPGLAQQSPEQEPPAPALLIYLGLILAGSAVSVLLARRQLQRQI